MNYVKLITKVLVCFLLVAIVLGLSSCDTLLHESINSTKSEEWVKPLENFSLENGFGSMDNSIVLRASEESAPVYAVQSGTVITINFLGNFQGSLVVIQHNDEFITAYANLQDNVPVEVGQQVKRGEIVGYTKNGILKFYTRVGSGNDARYIDPSAYLKLDAPRIIPSTKDEVVFRTGCIRLTRHDLELMRERERTPTTILLR